MRVVRDGAPEALHCGHVAVVDDDGALLAGVGDPATLIYPRSALKPFQAAASLAAQAPLELPSDEVALMSASHTGSRTHQAVVRRLLDRAGLGPAALRCPHTLPLDAAALRERPQPTRLAHNCSGKHAGFLVAEAHVGAGGGYLAPDTPLQRAVRRRLEEACDAPASGPGVDGCGAPAWRLTVRALARGYARLAGVAARAVGGAGAAPTSPATTTAAATAGGRRDLAPGSAARRHRAAPPEDVELAQVAVAMRTHPLLVGGRGMIDSELMRAVGGVLAKRGAEAVLGLAVPAAGGALGIAIKVSDGGVRALGPIAAAALRALGVAVPERLARPEVLGGGEPHGALEPMPELLDGLSPLRG